MCPTEKKFVGHVPNPVGHKIKLARHRSYLNQRENKETDVLMAHCISSIGHNRDRQSFFHQSFAYYCRTLSNDRRLFAALNCGKTVSLYWCNFCFVDTYGTTVFLLKTNRPGLKTEKWYCYWLLYNLCW